MLDNGAPYSALGYNGRCYLTVALLPSRLIDLEPVAQQFAYRSMWQYGMCQHASESRSILGSAVLPAIEDRK